MRMQEEHFLYLLANAEQRIQRCHRLLEDNRDLIAFVLAELLERHRDQVFSIKDRLSGILCVGRKQAHHRKAHRTLA